MDLVDFLKVLRDKWYLLLIFPLIFALVTAGYCWRYMPDMYTSKATLYALSSTTTDTTTFNGSTSSTTKQDWSEGSTVAGDVLALAQSSHVTSAVAQASGMSSLSGYTISTSAGKSNRVILLSVTGPSPEKTAVIANNVAHELTLLAGNLMGMEGINIIDSATVPTSPSGPDRLKYVGIAALVGLLAALALIALLDILDVSVRSSEEAEEKFGLPTLGSIPRAKRLARSGGFFKGSKRKKSLGEFQSPEFSNPVKTLLANIRFVSVDKPVKTITVTSTDIDEGKTAVASNLACSIAASGHTVLLVEADMRRRCLARLLEVRPQYGVYSVLAGDAQLKDAVVSTTLENLYFLGSESGLASPPDLLGTKRFEMLVDVLRQSFDYVIFDTPPLGTFVDGAVVGSLTDGVLLVVHQGKTKRKAVQQSVDQLKTAGCNTLGLVLTFGKQESNYYYYMYYNEDGKRITRRSKKKGSDANQEPPTGILPEFEPTQSPDAQGIAFATEDSAAALMMGAINDTNLEDWAKFAQEGMDAYRETAPAKDALTTEKEARSKDTVESKEASVTSAETAASAKTLASAGTQTPIVTPAPAGTPSAVKIRSSVGAQASTTVAQIAVPDEVSPAKTPTTDQLTQASKQKALASASKVSPSAPDEQASASLVGESTDATNDATAAGRAASASKRHHGETRGRHSKD